MNDSMKAKDWWRVILTCRSTQWFNECRRKYTQTDSDWKWKENGNAHIRSYQTHALYLWIRLLKSIDYLLFEILATHTLSSVTMDNSRFYTTATATGQAANSKSLTLLAPFIVLAIQMHFSYNGSRFLIDTLDLHHLGFYSSSHKYQVWSLWLKFIFLF